MEFFTLRCFEIAFGMIKVTMIYRVSKSISAQLEIVTVQNIPIYLETSLPEEKKTFSLTCLTSL